MIEDEVIREVRAAREAYAAAHGFNIRAIVADLQAKESAGNRPVVSLASRRLQQTQSPNAVVQPAEAAIPTLNVPSR